MQITQHDPAPRRKHDEAGYLPMWVLLLCVEHDVSQMHMGGAGVFVHTAAAHRRNPGEVRAWQRQRQRGCRTQHLRHPRVYGAPQGKPRRSGTRGTCTVSRLKPRRPLSTVEDCIGCHHDDRLGVMGRTGGDALQCHQPASQPKDDMGRSIPSHGCLRGMGRSGFTVSWSHCRMVYLCCGAHSPSAPSQQEACLVERVRNGGYQHIFYHHSSKRRHGSDGSF